MKKTTVFVLFILAFIIPASSAPQDDRVFQTTPLFTATPTIISSTPPTPTLTPAPTATPMGGGGKIIFLDGDFEANKWEIFSVNSNGTGRKQLTFLGGTIDHPVWSPNGERIVFSYKKNEDDFWQLYTMNADGSALTDISVNNNKNYSTPGWSPDGSKIVFVSETDEQDVKKANPRLDIFMMNADGTNEIPITNDPATSADDHILDKDPDWSPDGSKFVFISYVSSIPNIFIMNADGTEKRALTDFQAGTMLPKWSPDGKSIVFMSQKDGQNEWEIYIMNSDGTDVLRLTNNNTWDTGPIFSPDGAKIAWNSCCFNISIMNLDGSGVTKLYPEFEWGFDLKP